MITFSFYMHGGDLDPSAISSALEVIPSRAWKRDDPILALDGTIRGRRKAGMWSVVFEGEQNTAQDATAKFIRSIIAKGIAPSFFSGCERAYVDIYRSDDADESSGNKLNVELSIDFINLLQGQSLGLQVTLEVVPK